MFANIIKSIKSISMIERKTERFLSHILIPQWMLTFYFISLSRLFPEGVNKVFITRSGEYTFGVAGTLSLIFFLALGMKKGKLSFPKKSEEKSSANNLILLLLPLTPVAQYILSNRQFLSPLEATYTFVVFAVPVTFIVFFIPMLFKRIGSSQILMFVGLAFTFSVINMASLSWQFTWHEKGSLKIQLAVFACIFFLGWLFFYLKKQKLLGFLVVIMFLSTCITQLLKVDKDSSNIVSSEKDNKLLTLVNSRKPRTTPSIYLLIYDAYVVNETMLSHGIDNQAQEQYLEDLGFKIYPHSYSLASSTNVSMSLVFNASAELYGGRLRGCAGDGVVQNLLKRYGYKTYGIFPWVHCFRGYRSGYDYSVPSVISSPANDLMKGVMMGEFQFDIGYTDMTEKLYLDEKAKAFSEKTEYPKLIYTHSLVPGHSQNSGACLPDNGDIKIYYERVQQANLRMKQDLKILLENDPNAIIIVAGDHGPYLTKNCYGTGGAWVAGTNSKSYDISEIDRLDIQDRFGNFLAIRWPTQDFEEYDDITVLQDLFPAIFAYMFQDPNLLEAKVKPVTLSPTSISRAKVVDGIIEGGINSGEPLFIGKDK
jgi:hypothetical protein